MRELSNQELLRTEGGGISLVVGCVLATVAVLVAGILDGFTRPLKCNE